MQRGLIGENSGSEDRRGVSLWRRGDTRKTSGAKSNHTIHPLLHTHISRTYTR
jgi:hypothetical protein